LWSKLGYKESISYASWPKYDPSLIIESGIELPIQVKGKVRDKITVAADISQDELKNLVLSREKVIKWLNDGAEPKKFIYVKGKLVSIVP